MKMTGRALIVLTSLVLVSLVLSACADDASNQPSAAGMSGRYVVDMQEFLREIAQRYESLPSELQEVLSSQTLDRSVQETSQVLRSQSKHDRAAAVTLSRARVHVRAMRTQPPILHFLDDMTFLVQGYDFIAWSANGNTTGRWSWDGSTLLIWRELESGRTLDASFHKLPDGSIESRDLFPRGHGKIPVHFRRTSKGD